MQVIKNITVVNEGKQSVNDVWINGSKIAHVLPVGTIDYNNADSIVDGTGKHLFPG